MPRKEFPPNESFQSRLSGLSGRTYWRSLEELSGTPEFAEYLHREFPDAASEWDQKSSRREFLRVMAASLALGGLAGCRPQPAEKITPYVRQPEELVPGKPLYFASACPLAGFGTGVLVESHMGRPTKIEGNPDHPGSLGATSAQTQASLLDLYDPDRSQTVNYRRQIQTWDTFLTKITPKLDEFKAAGGAGLRLLGPATTSPTLIAQIQRLLELYPQARWHQYDAVSFENEAAGLRQAFGQPLQAIYDFRRADVVLSLDSDFLGVGPGQVRYAREFADRRSVAGYRQGDAPDRMSRVYAVESTPTITGAKADHRIPLHPSQIETFARALAARLNVPGINDPGVETVPAEWLSALADDLQSYRTSPEGSCLVVAGPWQSPVVHAIAHAINAQLGAMGTTVRYARPFDATAALATGSLDELIEDMQQGDVEVFVALDTNPVNSAPEADRLTEALAKVPLKIHFGPYRDETSLACDWHIPALHYLESWGDLRGYDGTVTIQQPLIAPLYDGRSACEVIAALRGEGGRRAYDLVREHWQITEEDQQSEDEWQTWLHNGVMPESAAVPETVELDAGFAGDLAASASDPEALVMVLRPDPSIYDGQFANNGWLQELPKPFTKLTWENAALMSPATARKLGVQSGDLVSVQTERGLQILPGWILPGQADNAVTVHLGYGRTLVGRVGNAIGVNVSGLRPASTDWTVPVRIAATGQSQQLASTQNHFLLDGRDLIRSGTVEELREHPEHPPFAASHHAGENPSLLPEIAYDGHKWGMVIDLNACSGCNACVVACQSENNVPVVGKDQVAKGREMHWLRIDTYFSEAPENPQTHFQPLPCMHCENAPCEVVCPVAATTHSPEGINEMTYNRCVGTRYCSNNCPYKVRRFNFLHYNDEVEELPILQMAQNPDVSVRARGVMEKCTYCVQRVNAARIDAEKEGRDIRDGEVVSACQGACPTQAIQFGNLNDSDSVVAQAHASPLRYSLLEDLNTNPRTTYLAEVRNPHPSLAVSQTHE